MIPNVYETPNEAGDYANLEEVTVSESSEKEERYEHLQTSASSTASSASPMTEKGGKQLNIYIRWLIVTIVAVVLTALIFGIVGFVVRHVTFSSDTPTASRMEKPAADEQQNTGKIYNFDILMLYDNKIYRLTEI